MSSDCSLTCVVCGGDHVELGLMMYMRTYVCTYVRRSTRVDGTDTTQWSSSSVRSLDAMTSEVSIQCNIQYSEHAVPAVHVYCTCVLCMCIVHVYVPPLSL